MPKRKQPLAVKVKANQVTITFNAKGWEPVYSKLIEFVGRHAEDRSIDIADYVAHAFELKGRDISPKNGSFKRFIEMLHIDVEWENNKKQNTTENINDLIIK